MNDQTPYHPLRHGLVALLIVMATATTQGTSQQEHGSHERGKAKIRFDPTTMIVPAGKHNAAEIITESARFLGWNILTDKEQLATAKPLQLQVALNLTKAQGEELLGEALWSAGIILVPRLTEKNVYEAVLLGSARTRGAYDKAPSRTPEQILARPDLHQPVRTTLRLQRAQLPVAITALRPRFLGHGKVPMIMESDEPTRTIVLTGVQSQVAAAIRLVRELDGPGAGPAGGPVSELDELRERVQALERELEVMRKRNQELEERVRRRR